MITKFKRYNNDDWKVGDIIVATDYKYDYHGKWIKEGEKYEIIYVGDNSQNDDLKDRIQVKDLNGRKYNSYFFKDIFVSLMEYDSKKYNL